MNIAIFHYYETQIYKISLAILKFLIFHKNAHGITLDG